MEIGETVTLGVSDPDPGPAGPRGFFLVADMGMGEQRWAPAQSVTG